MFEIIYSSVNSLLSKSKQQEVMRVYSIAYLLFTSESTYAALDKTVNCLRRRPKVILVYITYGKRQNHAASNSFNIYATLCFGWQKSLYRGSYFVSSVIWDGLSVVTSLLQKGSIILHTVFLYIIQRIQTNSKMFKNNTTY